MAEPADRSLEGARVVITAGGTREPIDPVRYIGNRSSGKMGNELAAAAARMGASVILVTAAPPPPPGPRVEVIRVETAGEMHAAVAGALPDARVLIMAAAVADWRSARVAVDKLKKHDGSWLLELVPTIDILRDVRDHPKLREGVTVVGFAAETVNLIANARAKLRDKDLDMIVVNDVSRADIGMGADDNEVTVIDREGRVTHIPRAAKSEVAAAILGLIVGRLQ